MSHASSGEAVEKTVNGGDGEKATTSTHYSVYPKPKQGPSVPKEEASSGFFAREITAFLSGVMVSSSAFTGSLPTLSLQLSGALPSPQSLTPSLPYTSLVLFHEDGLADMFDGFGGGWTKEAVLRIMAGLAAVRVTVPGGVMEKAVGVLTKWHPITLVVDTWPAIGVYVSGVDYALPLLRMAGAFVAAHVLGRWSCTYLLWKYPYVENHSAAGKEFLLKVTTTRLFWTTASTVVIVGFALLGCSGILGDASWGLSEDCLGATNQVVELCTYLALCVDWGRFGAWVVKQQL
ncbi:hypothetical protein BC829DRAFT_487538 [Chytridium lagenaria]|nr:hypothetical protein BC829DRAFT_487538 [Chytridium lagenaria]